jgi:hypothetical protein
LKPECPTYRLGSAVTEAIDVLAGEQTGDPKHFHGKPHSAPSTKGPSEA